MTGQDQLTLLDGGTSSNCTLSFVSMNKLGSASVHYKRRKAFDTFDIRNTFHIAMIKLHKVQLKVDQKLGVNISEINPTNVQNPNGTHLPKWLS